MIPTIKQKIAECEKGCGRKIDINGDCAYISSQGKLRLCSLCQVKIATWKEALKLAEESMNKIRYDTEEIVYDLYAYEKCNHKPLCSDAQMINGEWYHAIYGCDSVANEILNQISRLKKEVFGGQT